MKIEIEEKKMRKNSETIFSIQKTGGFSVC